MNYMARRRGGIMSDSLKMEIAKELGFYDTVVKDGNFGSVTARECGNMVKMAIEMAEKNLANPKS